MKSTDICISSKKLSGTCRVEGDYCLGLDKINKNTRGCCDGLECLVDYHPFNSFHVTKRCKKGENEILKNVIKISNQIQKHTK